MLTPLALATIFLLLAALASATMLVQDLDAGRLRQRIRLVQTRTTDQALVVERAPAIRSAARRGKQIERLMYLLQFNPAIPQQNIVPWRLVIATALGVALAGFFYSRALIGWPLAAVIMPVEAFFTAWCIFGWQRARFQKALLEQIPEVMALICRAVASGIPLTEALRSVAREADSPSREEFASVASEVATGQPLEGALWKLHERAGLPEYAFCAVTIGLQAQTGGSLVETSRTCRIWFASGWRFQSGARRWRRKPGCPRQFFRHFHLLLGPGWLFCGRDFLTFSSIPPPATGCC
jgi:tight adherence protein B